MPTIDLKLSDLEKLLGRKLPSDLDELFMYVKGEIDARDGDNIKLDVKDTNRPDLWSAEGIARELKARLGYEKGIPKYNFARGNVVVNVEETVRNVRPFIACGIAKNVKVDENFIVQMVQLQEKICTTFGRKRKEAAIGLYDFDKMKPPIFYRGYKDKDIEFVPLEWKVKMRPSEILKEHPKGKEFACLLENAEYYPIVIDSNKAVASMPPIINSDHTGKITPATKNIFVEVTGFDWETINIALRIVVMALADRGAKIEQCLIKFPKGEPYSFREVVSPFINTKKMTVDLEFIKRLSGLKLKDIEIIRTLEKARYNVSKKGKKLICEYANYRNDILHAVDVVEDLLIGYGYNKIAPEHIKLPTIGFECKESIVEDIYRDICVGLGLQEILTFTMTSKQKQASNILMPNEQFVEIANYVSVNYQIFRKRIFPELLEFLAKNKNQSYPQRIFEIGKTLELDENEENGVKECKKISIAIASNKTNFTEIKSILDAIATNRGFKYLLKETILPFFESGRAAEIIIDDGRHGFMGELNSNTLKNFGLENMVTILELEI